jgi:hypothetical protein
MNNEQGKRDSRMGLLAKNKAKVDVLHEGKAGS